MSTPEVEIAARAIGIATQRASFSAGIVGRRQLSQSRQIDQLGDCLSRSSYVLGRIELLACNGKFVLVQHRIAAIRMSEQVEGKIDEGDTRLVEGWNPGNVAVPTLCRLEASVI